MRVVFLVIALIGVTYAYNGFDGIGPFTVADFQCMQRIGYNFFVGRISRSNGSVDPLGVQNMKTAWDGGMTRVDAYIYPCVKNCTPDSPTPITAAQQIQYAVTAIKGINYNMFWVDVEPYSNSWFSDYQSNRDFLTAMTNELDAEGVNWGIYTNQNSWQAVVGNWGVYGNKPLWWTAYNDQPGFNQFKPFGKWYLVSMHQYQQNVKKYCKINIDQDWIN